MQYENFFESTTEATMRLRHTTILYDGHPYVVLCITNHMPDNVWRIYLDPIGEGESELVWNQSSAIPTNNYSGDYPDLGPMMDDWLDKMKAQKGGGAGPGTKVIRKMMNSPKFNKFRPFPLGMCNFDNSVAYLERQPTRRSEQGLTRGMVLSQSIDLAFERKKQSLSDRNLPDLYGPEFLACIRGDYPSAEECLYNLRDPDVINSAAAFHRKFALVRGPLDMLFLAYKSDIVGMLPDKDLSVLRLGRDFSHVKEVVELLGIFDRILQD